MRVELRTINHENIFHKPVEYWDEIQMPIIAELKRQYIYGKFPPRYCKDCGDPLKFSVQREFSSVKAVYHCVRCYGEVDESKPKVRWGYGI